MARYTGPKTKIARKFGEAIFGEDKSFEKKNYPPGQHGNNRRRGKKSEYAIQLMEKQKAKYTYGILERQFRNLFKKANQSKGVTGEVLLQSVDMDGKCRGYDVELAKKVVDSVDIPVVVSSGAGSLEDVKEVIEFANPNGVAIASLLHYDRLTIQDIKNYLRSNGISVILWEM